MIIGVDYDGTLIEHIYPEKGADVPLGFESVIELQNAGHRIILWTVRSGQALDAAVNYCESKGLKFWGINENPEHEELHKQARIKPSPKVHVNLLIDDVALGCPLIFPEDGRRPFVDWKTIRKSTLYKELIHKHDR